MGFASVLNRAQQSNPDVPILPASQGHGSLARYNRIFALRSREAKCAVAASDSPE